MLTLRRALAATLCCGMLATQVRAQALPAAVSAALAAAGVPESAFAAMLLPLQGGGSWKVQADRPMQPASTMKLVTSVVALDRLGPNHRGFTELLSDAPVQGGVLRGDLVLRGGADPDLGVPQLWAMLMELREQGIEQIDGDLLLDRTRWNPPRVDQGLPPFDDSPEFPYNQIPDALQLAGGLMTIEISADEQTVRARSVPALHGVDVVSAMTLASGRCVAADVGWQPAQVTQTTELTHRTHGTQSGEAVRIELRGSFPRQCTRRLQVQLIDRTLLAERLVRTLWAGLGGRWNGQVREAPAPLAARVLVRRDAPPWGEVMRSMNRRSENPETRMLFQEIGRHAPRQDMPAGEAPRTLEMAAREVDRWFDEQRIDRRGLVMDNGSGLSRSERITPRQLALLLQVAWRGRYASELAMSLPVFGIDTARLRDSPAAGWARLKDGTLRDVVALAGYARDAEGRAWVVAAMINHPEAVRARPALTALVDWLSRRGSTLEDPPLPGEDERRPGPQGAGP